MIVSTLLALLPALIGLAAVQPAGEDPDARRIVALDQIIMRVPIQPRLAPPQVDWKERKGPRCVPIAEISAAMLSGSEQVDFLLKDRRRVRARLSGGCAALDFYTGFYLRTRDERLCADRDMIHSRMGGRCEIDVFRMLEPEIRR